MQAASGSPPSFTAGLAVCKHALNQRRTTAPVFHPSEVHQEGRPPNVHPGPLKILEPVPAVAEKLAPAPQCPHCHKPMVLLGTWRAGQSPLVLARAPP